MNAMNDRACFQRNAQSVASHRSTVAEHRWVNGRYKYLLEHGETGLSTDFDLPTLLGYDSDHKVAVPEIGKIGVAVDTVEDVMGRSRHPGAMEQPDVYTAGTAADRRACREGSDLG